MTYWRNSQEKGSKYLLQIIFTQKIGKTTYTGTKKADWFLIISKGFPFYKYPNFEKVVLPTHVYLKGNYHLFLIIRHWSFFKYNDIPETLNVYKIPA